jgi:hypothetical protein
LVARLASGHRLDAALAEPGFARPDVRDRVPVAMWDAWRQARSRASWAAAIRFALLRRSLKELEPYPVILFKGFPAAELRYPSPGARDMGDVDLLVRDSDLGPVIERLRQCGYAEYGPGARRLDRSCFFEWSFVKEGLELDVHRGWSYPARLAIDYREVFERSLPWPSLGSNARLLIPEDAFLCQALQGPLAEFSVNAFPWVGMLDLREMLQPGPFWRGVSATELDRALVWQRAAEWRIRPALAAALRIGGSLFGALRDLAAEAVPALGPFEQARATLGTAGTLPPKLGTDATWLRMARRFCFTPAGDLAAVARQAGQRWRLSRAESQ